MKHALAIEVLQDAIAERRHTAAASVVDGSPIQKRLLAQVDHLKAAIKVLAADMEEVL